MAEEQQEPHLPAQQVRVEMAAQAQGVKVAGVEVMVELLPEQAVQAVLVVHLAVAVVAAVDRLTALTRVLAAQVVQV